MYRVGTRGLEVFLIHPGGPFFTHRDDGYWGIPKGLVESEERELDTAVREFEEETGIEPAGPYEPLGTIIQQNNKEVHAWAFEKDWDDSRPIRSNLFEMEWPPHSGRRQQFPEADDGRFFVPDEAARKINPTQWPLVERLQALAAKRDSVPEERGG